MNKYLNPSMGDSLLIAVIGFVVVFVVLVALLGIIILISKLFGEKDKADIAPTVIPEKQNEQIQKDKPYTGVSLHGVDGKTAAILMAIIADNLQKPLDKLRFISIREVK